MTRHIGKLTALKVSREKRPGLYGDGGGLSLQVTSATAKSWIFRYGNRYLGLGSAFTVSLQEARDLAHECRKLRQQGIDPIAIKRAKAAQVKLEAAKAITFGQCATAFIDAHKAEWKNAKHLSQWTNTVQEYCGPINDLPVQQIDTALVLKVLQPIWNTRTVTATRLRGRIESILDHAKVSGYRDGSNPAVWRGHLEHLLADPSKVTNKRNHAALAYSAVPAFMAKLRQQEGIAARALEFAILTAGRTGEVVGARWDEINLNDAVWVVPPERMKAGKEHRVPLSPAALAIIPAARRSGELVFPGSSQKALYNLLRRINPDVTTHGFRASFSTWAAEQTSVAREIVEAALAHAVENKVEAAYKRTDFFQKRRGLMDVWSRFCTNAGDAGVVRLRTATK
jgi:integrase